MKVHRLKVQTETQFQAVRDLMYQEAKRGKRNFYGLLELATNPVTILTAIHTMKANTGSNTPGSDRQKIKDLLSKDYDTVMHQVQEALLQYHPAPIRRVWIDKPGKKDKRPLGIPTIIDRLVQEVVKLVIEPVLEAQFFDHSYGFRPMRDTSQALARVHHILWQAKCTYAVEGDIRAFFDCVDHNLLLKKLWKMGIRDKRVLMLIKKMLKAGILHEREVNALGTPQGGILSPLLANAYLNDFDWYIAQHWEHHPKQAQYKTKWTAFTSMAKTGYPRSYLIRYADDWVILTDTLEHAQHMKHLAKHFLAHNARLELSEEKTLITDVKQAHLTFLGVETRVRKSRKGKGQVTYSRPSAKAMKQATWSLKKQARKIKQAYYRDRTIQEMLRYNAIAVGIGNYWSMTSAVSHCGGKVDHRLWYGLDRIFMHLTGSKLGQFHLRKIAAEQTSNLPVRHTGHKTRVPYLEFEGCVIGLTCLGFSTYQEPAPKIPKETPFTEEGRILWETRTSKHLRKMRPDHITMLDDLTIRSYGNKQSSASKEKRNFEYYMNRGYALNRDHGMCKICGCLLTRENLNTHHKQPNLPLEQVNKVHNLVSLCLACHDLVHEDGPNPFNPGSKPYKKLETFREQVRTI
jgi:group II intron reverse transcriptase/maturase